MTFSADAIVLKITKTGESDRLLTLLTRDRGIIKAFAKAADRPKNKLHMSTNLFCYGRFTFYESVKSTKVEECDLNETFFALQSDIGKLALAQYFNELMNEVRDEVGATNSNFMVPDGNSYYNSDGSWSDRISNHYVTANDMVKFAIYALNCPGIAKVVSTPSISFKLENGSSYAFNNTNGLIKPSSDYYYQYAIGIKTGTTNPAGQCLIFAAEVDGRVVIGAAMKSTNRHADALAILKAAFKN